MPILVFLGLSVLDLGPIVRDRQTDRQTDRRQSRFIAICPLALTLWAGHNNTVRSHPRFPPHRCTLYIQVPLRVCVQSVRSHPCVKSSACVTVRTISTAIFRVSDVVATRSLRQISLQLSRKSSGINNFDVRSEILFVKVNYYRHFIAEALGQRCVRTCVY